LAGAGGAAHHPGQGPPMTTTTSQTPGPADRASLRLSCAPACAPAAALACAPTLFPTLSAAVLTAAFALAPGPRRRRSSRSRRPVGGSRWPRTTASCSRNGAVAKRGAGFRDHGYGWIRLRLFHTPTMAQNLLYTTTLALQARSWVSSACWTFIQRHLGRPAEAGPSPRVGGLDTSIWSRRMFEYTRDSIARHARRRGHARPGPDRQRGDRTASCGPTATCRAPGLFRRPHQGRHPRGGGRHRRRAPATIMIHTSTRGGDQGRDPRLPRPARHLRRRLRRDRQSFYPPVARPAFWTCTRTWRSWSGSTARTS